MNNLSFWKEWHPSSRRVYLLLLAIFAGCAVAFLFVYPKGLLNIVSWERISELVKLPVVQEPILVGLFSFSYSLDYSIVQETFLGSSLQLSPIGPYILLAIVALSWILLLTIVSTLDGFWYYIGTLLLLGIILLFQLEQLLWFGQTEKTGVIIAFVLFLAPTFYFQQINSNYGLLTRLGVFAVATIIFGVSIWLFAEVSQPFLTLAYYGIGVPLVLSILFIMILGHELISFFTTLITQNNTPQSSRSLLHLSILSVVYLVNLGLLMLKNIGSLQWDIVYIDAFWLLLLLGIIGIWGFRQRENQYKFLFTFAPLGGLFYLTLGIITLTTVVFLSAQGNDPLLESLEDCIVYSQLGFSFIFLLYLIANFIQPLMKNQRVNLIMYRPTTLPYATALIGGAVATLGFFARGGFFAYYQMVAGYYNGIGDLHWMREELFVAEQYYKLSDQYANDNHRANYSLGALARAQSDPVLTAFYFQEALSKRPTPLSYANTAAAYRTTNQYFDALFTLKEGVKQFPTNAYLQNNLAMTYGQTDILDSALYWLNRSATNVVTESASTANTLSLIAKQRSQVDIPTDSIASEFITDDTYPPNIINLLALIGQQPMDSVWTSIKPTIPADSALSSYSYAQLQNYLLAATPPDTALVSSTELLSELGVNFPYTEELVLASAQARYDQNQTVSAFRKLDRLQSVNVFKQNYYLDIMGLWALEQQAPRFATNFFAQLAERNYQDSKLKFAISLTESLSSPDVQLTQAIGAWQDLLRDSTQVEHHSTAQNILQIITNPYASMETDIARYQWIRYRWPELLGENITEIFKTFEDNSYAAIALYDLVSQSSDEIRVKVRQIVSDLQKRESSLNYQGTIYLEWAWALTQIHSENVEEWKNRINMLVPLTRQQSYQKQYYRALLAEKNDEQLAESIYFNLLGNPFFEPGFISAVSYLYQDDVQRAYELWLDAIQTNPFSSKLLEEYIISAILMGLENYAEESLVDYRDLVSEDRYQQFLMRYQSIKEESEVVF